MKYRYIYICDLVTVNKTQSIENVSHVSVDYMYARQENIYVRMNIVKENIIIIIIIIQYVYSPLYNNYSKRFAY
jgi:hypothetical protein